MTTSRRNFLLSVCAFLGLPALPSAARKLQNQFGFKLTPNALDEMNRLTLQLLDLHMVRNNFFAPNPFFTLMRKRAEVEASGGRFIGPYCRESAGAPWKRFRGRY